MLLFSWLFDAEVQSMQDEAVDASDEIHYNIFHKI